MKQYPFLILFIGFLSLATLGNKNYKSEIKIKIPTDVLLPTAQQGLINDMFRETSERKPEEAEKITK